MTRDIKSIISQMTLEEKAGLCSGLDFWHTKSVLRLGIPSIMVTDGPHGLRKQSGESDHLGLNCSVPATCFPSGATLASSWDRSLIEKVGIALGEECQAEDVSILLGPAANIKRSPLCGRNFEYFSEDPYLSSQMAASHIKGVQSQGVGTSLKHFAVNNQEHRRLSINAVIDERTLREIYLSSFEAAVKQSKPWTVMCAYNKINGDYCSENEYLLNSILKKEWCHEGFIMSDWGAVNERVGALKAGLELEMPSSNGLGDSKIVEAVKNKSLSEDVLDKAVERILGIIFKAVDNKKENSIFDKEEHHKLARKVARECMVLLKNEENILPLKKEGTIAIIGAFVKTPRYQGGGSSHINPTKLDNVLDEIKKSASINCNISYSQGFSLISDDTDEYLVDEAITAAAKSQVAVIFAGLPDRYESEGYDRTHMRIPENQIELIQKIAKVQDNIVVILSNGSPLEMPWLNNIKGVLEGYIGGQAAGGAVADLLFGDFSPCGKLAETFPKKLSDNPSYLNFPGEDDTVEYKEGLFVGYRYYDKKDQLPLFSFGYGLSYTSFEYSDITLDKKTMSDNETLKVCFKIKNTGKTTGKEIAQLYVNDVESTVIRPLKELKAFEKVELKAGEDKTITLTLDKRAFAYYNLEIKDWHIESGNFEILVGASSKDIKLKEIVYIKSTVVIEKKFSRNSTLGDIMIDPYGAKIAQRLIKDMLGEEDSPGDDLGTDMNTMFKDFVLRSMVTFSGNKFTEEIMDSLIEKLNND
ncbi:glycoside hydrolase family 3 C-terminal domain-containing protein [Clostridium estertheticum]|uniref:glycoside hydrolase family 3 C-terminal domain-containing protein n=1 Tax=Clostridium estertheticum TaxID=238834 RepID=UPI001CF299F0|nr:glycoside hydrolase family 3 C-terminal domain-containing protein [Clostridium estertheticum]MCB2339145.1 glycoside hydrolase family 3 C-terminal domain-containing protein [Clostridium estertheticum]